jgi:CDP-glucose 4,6-dehydratase
MDKAFWRGKRVFVTGHTGFKGSWLSLVLHTLGAEMAGYALAPETDPSLFDRANIASCGQSTIADIRDAAALSSALKDFQPDIVLHLAAQALVRQSYVDPVGTYATNVMGTVNVLEAVRSTPSVRAVVVVTTDKCYENREWPWGYRETDAMGGYDPYSSSKGCAELVVSAYRRSFFPASTHASHGVGLASARAGNVIGGGDWSTDRLIPDIVRAIAEGRPVQIRNPHAIRPWQHVLEPVRGYLMLAQALFEKGPAFADAWNFGPYDFDARPVEWIVRRMTELWGDGASWAVDPGDHPHEAQYLKLDCSKTMQQLEWRPRWSLDQSIGNIVSWHKAVSAGEDARALTLQQIEAYNSEGAYS